ncbi:MAG: divergent polysaccharide deacetylase family protein [Paracoccaceae bacterium]
MNAESEAGGGFWRGFFTGLFLLLIGTIALMVFFPIRPPAVSPVIVPAPEAVESGAVIDPDGDAGDGNLSGETRIDTASLGPATAKPEHDGSLPPAPTVAGTGGPPATATPPETALTSTTGEIEQLGTLAGADEAPVISATSQGGLEETAGAGETPVVLPAAKPRRASIAVVAEIGAPSADGAAVTPEILAGNEAPPARPPLPQKTGENLETVARAPSVSSGGAETPDAPRQETETVAMLAGNSDAGPKRVVPSSRLTDDTSISVTGAPRVAPSETSQLARPSGDNGVSATRLPTIAEENPLGGEPALGIARNDGPSVSPGVKVPRGRTIGTPVRTFVSAPDETAARSTAEAPPVGSAETDGSVRIAMAPLARAPSAETGSVSIDTSTAPKPRKRPEPPVADGPAFEVFAAEFHDTGARPLLSIILQDIGDAGIDREELVRIQIPVTYAIDAGDPDAPWAEAGFREAGFEVLAMVPAASDRFTINRGEDPAGAATKLAAYFSAVPGAIGIVDRIDGQIQRDNNLVKALIGGLKPTGHAMLLNKGNGFGSGLELARLENIPSASVLRLIDKDRSPLSIRANLDRAALEASKTGSAVVIGRTYPETVTTLVRWLLGSTARSVTLAPVSAAIRRQ